MYVEERDVVTSVFGYNMETQENGFKYQGLSLKPNSYKNLDWLWLVKRIDKKLSNWVYRFLSLGRRLNLVQEVLSSVSLYWFSLMMVPKSIIKYIRSNIYNFLWRWAGNGSSFHLVASKHLALPKGKGGWNIKNLDDSVALCV